MAHVLFYKIRRSKCVGVVMEHFEGVGLTWGWYIRMPYRELTLGSSFNYSKLTEWYVSFFFTLPSPSICKTAGHHSTKRAGELLTAENVEECNDHGVQKEQFARVWDESHDFTDPRLTYRLANKDGQEKASQRKSE